MLEVEIWTIVQTKEGCVVLLRPLNKKIAVPIFVGLLEIQSIIIGKENISLPRPLTHDLFLGFMDSLNLVLDRMEIHALVDDTFYAKLIITGDNFTEKNPLVLDSRPSDALGLAVRRKCPILISSEIVRQTGISIDIFTDAFGNDTLSPSSGDENALPPQNEKRRLLLKKLNEAVEKEEYEQAAMIRDILNGMEGG